MNHLTDKQVDYIVKVIGSSKITSQDMKEDLVDHLCCAIEEEMAKGKNFDNAYDLAYRNISPDGFDEIERETIFLLTSKKINAMKRLLYISGYLTVFFATASAVLKMLHIPGGSLGILATGSLMSFLFIPTLFIYLYKSNIHKNGVCKVRYMLGFVAVLCLCFAIFTHLFHWPGSILMLIIALAIINFALLPSILFKKYKKIA